MTTLTMMITRHSLLAAAVDRLGTPRRFQRQLNSSLNCSYRISKTLPIASGTVIALSALVANFGTWNLVFLAFNASICVLFVQIGSWILLHNNFRSGMLSMRWRTFIEWGDQK